ncbi:MAG: prolipoprotein diacylglyceryl transferase family protein [Bryobacteraceae bacterium]
MNTPAWPLPPRIPIAGRPRCSFQVFGLAGLVAGVAMASVAGWRSGLSPAAMGLLATLAFLTFAGLALATKAIAGEERLVYYHHEIAILLALWAALVSLGLPVAPYLDAAVAGLGSFLFFGRIGCSSVGCCYGRPARWGWRYGREHVAAGFAAALQGVPIAPVQWIEAAGVFAITTFATVSIWRDAPAGTALSLYLGGYAALRFGLEYWRGDPARRRVRAWTEAQWTSIGVLGVVLWNIQPWLVVVPAVAAVAGLRARRETDWLEAAHVIEIAAALRDVSSDGGPDVRRTSRGLRISKAALPCGSRLYALSSDVGSLPEPAVTSLVRLIALIENLRPETARIIRVNRGVVSLVFSASEEPLRGRAMEYQGVSAGRIPA